MEPYFGNIAFRPEFRSKEVVLQTGIFPADTKVALANMADVDDDKMSIIISVTRYSMTNHKFSVHNDDGVGVFFHWYNQLSSGYKKGMVQFILSDTVTNIRLDYEDDPQSTIRDKQMLTNINRRGGFHELVGRFKVEILHDHIKEMYDKITRYFEKIEEPLNLPQPESLGGLDEAVYEGSDGNRSGDDDFHDDHHGNGLFIDPKLLGEKEKLKSVSNVPNIIRFISHSLGISNGGNMGFDFDSAVGGKGFADLFGGQASQNAGSKQSKPLGGRKNSFEDLLK